MGHFTHTERLDTVKISEKDFEGNLRSLYFKGYEHPHETTGVSYNREGDEKKLKNTKKCL